MFILISAHASQESPESNILNDKGIPHFYNTVIHLIIQL